MAAIVTSFGRAVVKVTSCCPVSPVRIIATRVPSGDTATLKSDLPLRTNCGGCWRSRGSASVRMFWNVMIPCVLSGLTAPPLGVVDGFPEAPLVPDGPGVFAAAGSDAVGDAPGLFC